MFDVVGDRQLQGLDAYRKSWLEDFSPGTDRPENSSSTISGFRPATVAFATALLDCAGNEYGKPAAFDLRLTVGFEKRQGQWTFVHEHPSQAYPPYDGPAAPTA